MLGRRFIGGDAWLILGIVWEWIEEANDGVGGDVGDLIRELLASGYGPPEED